MAQQIKKVIVRCIWKVPNYALLIDVWLYLAPLQLTHGLSWTSGKVVRMKYPQHTGTSQHPLVGPGQYVAKATRCCWHWLIFSRHLRWPCLGDRRRLGLRPFASYTEDQYKNKNLQIISGFAGSWNQQLMTWWSSLNLSHLCGNHVKRTHQG